MPKESPAPSKPVKPSTPSKSAKPADPAKSADPVDPAKPVDPSLPEATGLTSSEAAQRLRQDGPNALGSEGHRGPLAVLISQFASPLVLILVAASAVSMVVGDRVEAGIILAIVAMSALLGFVQEARSEAAVAALQARLALRATVVRDGKQQEIRSARSFEATLSSWAPAISCLRTRAWSRPITCSLTSRR
jgi:magnesium-transporting ATPase (P-type)